MYCVSSLHCVFQIKSTSSEMCLSPYVPSVIACNGILRLPWFMLMGELNLSVGHLSVIVIAIFDLGDEKNASEITFRYKNLKILLPGCWN